MRLQVGGGLDDVGRADHPAHAPAGHGVGLGDAVEDDHLVAELRHRGGDGGERHAVVGQVLVDLVGDHPQALGRGPLADLLDLLRRVHGAGGVGRGDEEQDLGALREGRLQLVHGDQVALLRAGENLHRHAAGQPDGLRVGGPERGRNNDLVARIQQGGEGVVDGLLAAVGHQHLGRRRPCSRNPAASCPRWPASARAARRRGSSGGTCGWPAASMAASRCSPGVGKSGSPAPKPITGRPAAFSAFALASTARVADSAMAEMRWEMRAADMAGPFFACSWKAGCGIRRNLLYAVQRIARGAGTRM